MGLRPLDLAQWLEFGDEARGQLDQKRELLREHRDDVLIVRSGTREACEELLEAVLDNLRDYHPDVRAQGGLDDDPLAAASLLVPEDLCVMVEIDGTWRLEAACVCFPSRWRLADKVGTSIDAIHSPVPGYEDDLAEPTRRFFDRLADRAFWRLNWTMLDDPTLFQPIPVRRPASDDPGEWLFRVERQTLRRLATSGAVIFTIRTYVTPARVLVERVEGIATDVATVLNSAPSATIDYKGWSHLCERWSDWFGV